MEQCAKCISRGQRRSCLRLRIQDISCEYYTRDQRRSCLRLRIQEISCEYYIGSQLGPGWVALKALNLETACSVISLIHLSQLRVWRQNMV